MSRSALVSREDLERRLVAAAKAGQPVAGLFGPGSQLWRINRHAAIFAGSGRAALLQIAHPQVAQAIVHHSKTRTDPYGRFQRTFRQVFSMVWGDLESALTAARHVHRVHETIHGVFDEDVGPHRRGEEYRATDRRALVWVHATLWESSITMYEALLGPLSAETKERYYGETRRFAWLFGLDDEDLPRTWSDFVVYNREMWACEQLSVGAAGREIAGYLFAAPDPMLAPLTDRFRILTSGLLPVPVREKLGLPWGARERRVYERSLDLLRRVLPRLPPRLRYVPGYFQARRRLAGEHGLDPIGSILDRVFIGAGSTTSRP